MPTQVLVVDDDSSVRELVCDALVLAGYQTQSAQDGLVALSIQKKNPSDLIVSDVNMPKLDGYQLAQKLRDLGDATPIIFLTARSDKPDVSRGFRVGADDYIPKPFGIEELVLRVGAVLRRVQPKDKSTEKISIGPISIDPETIEVTVAGNRVVLSPTEYRLLITLVENRNRVLSRQFLLDAVWDMGFADSATVVDTYISYLRKKLHTPDYEGIRTVRGFGFQIMDK